MTIPRHLTIPAHKSLRVGALLQILQHVAAQTGSSMDKILQGLEG